MERLENYVINRLEHLELRRTQLYEENRMLRNRIEDERKKYAKLAEFLKTHSEITTTSDGSSKYVNLENIYEKYEEEDFNYLMEIIG